MKKIILFFALIPVSTLTYSQCGERYQKQLFDNIITPSIPYGQNTTAQGATQVLTLDLYEPLNDTAQARPLIIWAFPGSFTYGDKKSPDIVQLSNIYSKMGYVCAAIDYRLGFEMIPPTQEMAIKAVIRGLHDGKAAVRFFRKNATQYKIDTTRIIFGGSSAGAFIALHMAYITHEAELISYYDMNKMGGLEGNSGNPGYSSKIDAVINLCGALGEARFMEAHELLPTYSMHGTADSTVPYGHGPVSLNGDPIIVVDGSGAIETFAVKREFTNYHLYTFYGADHVPYVPLGPIFGTDPQTAKKYMDTVVNFITPQLYNDIICKPVVTGVDEKLTGNNLVSIYPNPSNGSINLNFKFDVKEEVFVQLYSLLGKREFDLKTHASHFVLDNIAPGYYFIRVSTDEKSIIERLIVRE